MTKVWIAFEKIIITNFVFSLIWGSGTMQKINRRGPKTDPWGTPYFYFYPFRYVE